MEQAGAITSEVIAEATERFEAGGGTITLLPTEPAVPWLMTYSGLMSKLQDVCRIEHPYLPDGFENLIGRRFGHLVVRHWAGTYAEGIHPVWWCRCDCGVSVLLDTRAFFRQQNHACHPRCTGEPGRERQKLRGYDLDERRFKQLREWRAKNRQREAR